MRGSSNLEELRTRPIPDLDGARATRGKRSWPIDATDRRYAEACRDARMHGIAGSNYYHRSDNPPYNQSIPGSVEELYLRESVIGKLRDVNERLKPAGLELFLFDAWRPAVVQHYMFSEWAPGDLRAKHPDWSEEKIMEEVSTYWARSAPNEKAIDHNSPPPHATGAVADLSIRHINGELLSMGSAFDDPIERSFTDALEKEERGGEALGNRRVLYWVMTEEGFIVNPNEWWHVSFGDQLWAQLTSFREGYTVPAFYSAVDPR